MTAAKKDETKDAAPTNGTPADTKDLEKRLAEAEQKAADAEAALQAEREKAAADAAAAAEAAEASQAQAKTLPKRVEKPSDLEGYESNLDYDGALRRLLVKGIVDAVEGSVQDSRERQRDADRLIEMGAEITRPPRYLAPGISPKPEDFRTVRFDPNGDLVGVTDYGTKVRVHPDGSSTIQCGPGYDATKDIEVAAPQEVVEAENEPGRLERVGGGIQASTE
jgi:hypothetical protein